MGRLIVAFLTLIVAGLLGIGVLLAKRPAPPPPPQAVSAAPAAAPREVVHTVSILVAARRMRAGMLLQHDDMAATSVAQGQIPAGGMIDGVEARTTLRGAMVRKSLEVGDPLTVEGVLRPGDRGFLAAVLAPGSRAVSVQVDSVSGSAGLIWPGDRIDLILTEAIEDPTKPMGKRLVGERVLENLRVIAVDQQMVEGGQQNPMPAAMANNRILTLEVGATGAEKVAVAARLGKLSAVIRSAVEAPLTVRQATMWADEVSPALRATSSGPVKIYRATDQPAPAGK